MLLLLFFALLAPASEPPADLARRVAAREAESEAERANYTYTQTVTVHEYDRRNRPGGMYREVREVIFSPSGERAEQTAGKTVNTLRRLLMSPEDFADIREIQPLLLTTDRLRFYESRFRGEETIESIACWVLQITPRQLLYGQRLFEGMIWIDQRDFSIIRSEGRAVPQILSSRAKKENLFPRFTTVREKIGDYWFPLYTHADDTLAFSSGPLRMKMTIEYRDYKRFGAESRILPEIPE